MSIVPAHQQQMPDNGNGYGQVAPYQYQQPLVPAQQPVGQEMRLTEWANEARAAAAVAASLVKTSFVPKDFRGKVEEATAAILTGAEMGLSPMASLRAIYVIHGTPGMYAKTMRAVVQSKGHEIWVHEATATRVTVKGRRKGSDHVESSTWTMDRVKTAGLQSNDQYRKNPQNMLMARATSEVCWLIASDALSGIAASVEELEAGDFSDGDMPAPTEEEKPARRTAKRKPLEKAEGTEPALPPAQATIERQDPATEPVSAPPAEGGMSEVATRRMFAMFREAGITEKADQIRYIAEVIGREIESRKELTPDEGSQIMDALSVIIPLREPVGGDES